MAEKYSIGPEPSAPPLSLFESFDRKCSIESTSSPFTPGKCELPSYDVELTVSARNLLNLDTVSKSDPVCILYMQDSQNRLEWIEVDRTECIKNDLNPSWSKKFALQYKFEERQMIRFKIYDWDGNSQCLEAHDFLGKMECALGEIVSAPNSKLSRQLILPSVFSDKLASSITVVAEEIGECKKVLTLKISTRIDVRRGSFKLFANTIPCLVISKQLDDSSWTLIFKTEKLDRQFSLRMSSITSGRNFERPLRWQIFHKPMTSKLQSAKLAGEFTTNYLDIVEKYKCKQASFLLRGALKNQDSGKPQGCIDIVYLLVEDNVTFLDHIKNGLELSITIAIDFTASNGDPARHTSLHYKHGGMDNPYVLAIKAIGEIIQDYSKDKRFAAFGFGAKGFPDGNRVSHNFPINLKQTNPYCEGIDGVLTAYTRVLKRIKLFGPTCFTPVIREQARIARENRCGRKYFVLLILTDGIICDPDTTREAIITASVLPMSIIIIGVGDEKFTDMERLDCDESLLKSGHKKAERDIVQFVELNKFVNFKSLNPITPSKKTALTQAILAELPNQVCEWMRMHVK